MADTLVLSSQSFLISTDVAYIEFKIWGGGGAGENVNDNVDPFVRGPGGDGGDIGDNIPPWIIDCNDDGGDGSNGSSNRVLWRLPNCIISDIRMPGGVDGVQLLQLLRQQRMMQSPTMGRQSSKNKKKKGRERNIQKKKKKKKSENEYDGKDDFELLDAIVGNGNGGGKSGGDKKNGIDRRRIVTAIDQANQKLDVISDTLAYHQEAHNNNSEQYPNSLHQIPVILLTAKAMVSDRIVGYRAGANNYLPKPFRPEELLGMVDSLMRKQESLFLCLNSFDLTSCDLNRFDVIVVWTRYCFLQAIIQMESDFCVSGNFMAPFAKPLGLPGVLPNELIFPILPKLPMS